MVLRVRRLAAHLPARVLALRGRLPPNTEAARPGIPVLNLHIPVARRAFISLIPPGTPMGLGFCPNPIRACSRAVRRMLRLYRPSKENRYPNDRRACSISLRTAISAHPLLPAPMPSKTA
jgi:hypothetical protein